MTDAIKQALLIAEKIKKENLPDEQKFGIALTLAAAGLGVAKHLLSQGKINQQMGLVLRNDVQLLLNDLDTILTRH